MKKVELYKDRNKEWRWKVTSKGQRIGAATEGYKRKSSAVANLKSIRNVLNSYFMTD